jgi:hypothetical protein
MVGVRASLELGLDLFAAAATALVVAAVVAQQARHTSSSLLSDDKGVSAVAVAGAEIEPVPAEGG